jgi:hypothetical protein
MSATRHTRTILAAALAAGSVLLSACGSNSSTPVSTHPAGVPYFSRVGTGNATLPQIALPSTWSLVWRFNCSNPSTRRSFVLMSTPSSGSTTQVTSQVGLEGGGFRPFHTAGDFTFAVTTTCGWHLLVGTAGTQTISPTTTKP